MMPVLKRMEKTKNCSHFRIYVVVFPAHKNVPIVIVFGYLVSYLGR